MFYIIWPILCAWMLIIMTSSDDLTSAGIYVSCTICFIVFVAGIYIYTRFFNPDTKE
jgi:hypothetical protein